MPMPMPTMTQPAFLCQLPIYYDGFSHHLARTTCPVGSDSRRPHRMPPTIESERTLGESFVLSIPIHQLIEMNASGKDLNGSCWSRCGTQITEKKLLI
jgi:hypothetical protein